MAATTITIQKKELNKKNLCGFCGKSFKRKTFYEEHIILCEQLHNARHLREDEKNEEFDLPSRKELYSIVRNLSLKYDELVTEVHALRSYVNKQKKKINILEWLNENCSPEMDYVEWVHSLNISDELLENTFKYGIVQGIMDLIIENMPLENVKNHPIKCFQQKQFIFFRFRNGKWSTMGITHLESFFDAIHCLFMRAFQNWKKENQEQIDEDERFYEETYLTNMQTILASNRSKDFIFKNVKSKLYHYLKMNLKHIVEYEFTF